MLDRFESLLNYSLSLVLSFFSTLTSVLLQISRFKMEKTTSVLGAFEAGKIPSQDQFNKAIDWLLSLALPNIKGTANAANLSQQGRLIADGLREVMEAYKILGTNKNCLSLYHNCL